MIFVSNPIITVCPFKVFLTIEQYMRQRNLHAFIFVSFENELVKLGCDFGWWRGTIFLGTVSSKFSRK